MDWRLRGKEAGQPGEVGPLTPPPGGGASALQQRWRRRAAAAALCLLASGATSGCATWGERHYGHLTHALHARAYDDGLQRIEREKTSGYGGKNELLYWLDRAAFEDASGERANSTASLEAAKAMQRRLYTQHVLDHAEAFVWGERMLPYSAEPFEQVAVHLLEADHYLAVGARGDALAELRQMDTTLARCNELAGKSKSVYQDDAAGRWLAGLVREADRGELAHLSDARIDLARAVALYDDVEAKAFRTPCPPFLRQALRRVEQALGPEPPAARGPARSTTPEAALTARAVLLFYDGLAPHKQEAFWDTLLPPYQTVRVAYPIFVPTPSARRVAWLSHLPSGARERAEVASDFSAKAQAHLAERASSLRTRALARALAKAAASSALSIAGMAKGGQGGGIMELAGFGLNVANTLSEHADLRSWRTLPARLSVAEISFPAGEYALAVTTQGSDAVQREHQYQGTAAPGEVVFVSVREL